jgi:thioredoxin-like negative regulator of GroEL
MRWMLLAALLLARAAVAQEPALFVVVQIDPDPDAFRMALRDEIANARREGLKPYVELWAPWCRACATLKNSLGDPRVQKALAGTYIIMVNVDDWGDRLPRTGFAPRVIPTLYELRADGSAGRQTDGSSWGADRPENVARWLDRFLHRR